MFEYLRGKLASVDTDRVVVDVGGLGYRLHVPARTLRQLPAIGSDVQLYTLYVVRETSATLYGFIQATERDLFEQLTAVSGIGPKMALSLLGTLTVGQLRQAVCDEDASALAKAPGIGRKTAQRLVLELRDRLALLLSLDNDTHLPSVATDAVNALINLGYGRAAAQETVKTCLDSSEGTEISLEKLIRVALQKT